MSRHVMNNMQLVMDAILRAGRPIQEAEIALMTGMDPLVVNRSINNAISGGYMTRIPAQFKVTPHGAASVEAGREGKRAPGRPRGYKPQSTDRQEKADRKDIEAEEAERRQALAMNDGMVERAIKKQPALVTAWGGACNVA